MAIRVTERQASTEDGMRRIKLIIEDKKNFTVIDIVEGVEGNKHVYDDLDDAEKEYFARIGIALIFDKIQILED